jgi:succinate dehydrogenase / fumarate reductase iron-sulfur subunit
MDKVTPYLTPKAEIQDGKEAKREPMVIRKEDQEAIDRAQKCIMCGCCNSACNALEVNKDYLAPAALAKAWRFVGDVREGNSEKRLEHLSEDHGVWDCVRCFHCTEYCPKDVAPLRSIEKLRSRAIKSGIIDNHGAKHTLSMTDSIKRVGRLDEAAMTFKTLGFLRSLGMIPLGIKMQLHGKMPRPIIFPKIKGMDEIDKIYRVRYKKRTDKKKGD